MDAYYKGIRDIVDNQEIGDTLLEVPINEARGIVRGLEVSLDRSLSRCWSFNGSYGLSRGLASGPIVGGFWVWKVCRPAFSWMITTRRTSLLPR